MAKAKTKPTILIVEDENALLDLYQIRLIKEGYNVILASNGEEGLSQALNHLPNLILLDLVMPQVDGYTLIRELKVNPSTKKIPIVIFSNLSQPSEVEKGLKLGAQDYIVKSNVTPSQLAEKVKVLLPL
ncbi:MAG: response regulator [Candidatus Buchananbacteria bacterium CG10_big_fil_rev_8_21_14_0_10_42_9]|uniref:Response regulator n=1 Tax=Candidatus Buchananbacteria bacterium CG10_big_fil_rev_8_21_14_0_10_42_9 TaxID=1974526 RepID=A0A2H0W0X8_9BACT|nr:MAG: response regulator [Candidatus Buchananbacteria bacterium CG10_big_fil_rev_8_21_14_0_10_42_9]